METKTKKLLLENYKKMYESMKNSADKQRIGKLIKELEAELFNTDVYIEDFK
jgi:hypothetical protein